MYFYSVWIISVKALGFVVRNVGLWLAPKSKKCVFPIYDSSAGFADIPVLMFILRLKRVSIDKDIYKKRRTYSRRVCAIIVSVTVF